MRHVIYHHMKEVMKGKEPPEYDEVLGVRCTRNQYPTHRDNMIEEVKKEICPSTTSLNHR